MLPLTDRWYLSTGSTFSSYEYMLIHLKTRITSSPEVYILQEHTQTQNQSMDFR